MKLAARYRRAQWNFALDSTFTEIESEKLFFYKAHVANLPQTARYKQGGQFACC
ncbi:hypothetical protein IMCC12053_1696 [Celeribacter marinus]|uniref:Uncharacterized protein n=1 Tax=Celeribacter marinus TaxID=1397108 RepID=A0A0N9ZZ99_9RHOB|nr:hypothetical protein IMCC12053_1696 [Celeribacter marinus]